MVVSLLWQIIRLLKGSYIIWLRIGRAVWINILIAGCTRRSQIDLLRIFLLSSSIWFRCVLLRNRIFIHKRYFLVRIDFFLPLFIIVIFVLFLQNEIVLVKSDLIDIFLLALCWFLTSLLLLIVIQFFQYIIFLFNPLLFKTFGSNSLRFVLGRSSERYFLLYFLILVFYFVFFLFIFFLLWVKNRDLLIFIWWVICFLFLPIHLGSNLSVECDIECLVCIYWSI